MARFMDLLKKKVGKPPGTLVYTGDRKVERTKITLIDYDADRCRKKSLKDVKEAFPFRDTPTVSWLNIDGLHDVSMVEEMGAHFNIHPLVLEDILSTGQRPKVEDYGDYFYIVLKMLRLDPGEHKTISEQVSLVVGRNWVISFQEAPGDVFDPVRERLDAGKGKIRRMGADYLAYVLIDTVVDNYFIVLEELGDRIAKVEESLMDEPREDTLHVIHALKRETLHLRKFVWPLRDLAHNLERSESKLISRETKPFLRDVSDHTIRVIDSIETYRDLSSGLLELYLSSISNRMNEVMKVLTIIATIFIPLTFIAGIYGMNFARDSGPYGMPELYWYWGYPAVLVVMVLIVVLMAVYFKWKKWL